MTINVCLVSYFTSPYKGVGSLRPNYWLRTLGSISEGKICIEVVTATPNCNLPSATVISPYFRSRFDQGLGWIIPLFIYLLKNRKKYNCFLFTGGPYLHFILTPFIKLMLYKNVILDYRDPFGNNPVFRDNPIKSSVKRTLEFIFNFYADTIVTVNSCCADLISAKPNCAIKVIDNGYDDLTPPSLLENFFDKHLLLAGGFSQGRDVGSLIKALESYKLVHIGNSKLSIDVSNYVYLGYKEYPETLGYISNAEICLIFTSGHPYESTTKIFDYLRFNKKILVISDIITGYGGLWDITKNNPNIVWVINNPIDIKFAIDRLMKQGVLPINNEKFSRRHGADKLKEIILEMCNSSN